jgi:hypothetical protein
MSGVVYNALFEHLILRGFNPPEVRGALASLPTIVEILAERARQELKFGRQLHEDGCGPGMPVVHFSECVVNSEVEEAARNLVESSDDPTWSMILDEEVWETKAADGDSIDREIIQVAAVAVAWHTDRRLRAK